MAGTWRISRTCYLRRVSPWASLFRFGGRGRIRRGLSSTRGIRCGRSASSTLYVAHITDMVTPAPTMPLRFLLTEWYAHCADVKSSCLPPRQGLVGCSICSAALIRTARSSRDSLRGRTTRSSCSSQACTISPLWEALICAIELLRSSVLTYQYHLRKLARVLSTVEVPSAYFNHPSISTRCLALTYLAVAVNVKIL